MNPAEKTVVVAVRFPQPAIEAITSVSDGDEAEFIRTAVAEKMERMERPISVAVQGRGGNRNPTGRPVGAGDKRPRKRKVS